MTARALRQRYRLLFAVGVATAFPWFLVAIGWVCAATSGQQPGAISTPLDRMPAWLLLAPVPLFPLILWLTERTRQQLVAANENDFACPQCGYDLRASADRCPECGKAI